MRIQRMFFDDINRPINGVIKVDQDSIEIVEQEVREYVITKELRKHFSDFFNYYSDAFDVPTADIGVWISGFFGSGKSHFLKILSYILENKAIGSVNTIELFRQKFDDDPATFMMMDKAVRCDTETILFNIDIEGSINKDKTAVMRVFAKMFYNHLGFYGENLKVAMLEYYIEKSGKTEEFHRVFEEKKGRPWVEMRRAFAFNGKFIIPSLMEVLDMSEDDAKLWFNDKTAVELSIAQLVHDIKEYVDGKPENFRLLFMIDEAGQYVGTDTDMLLNLQSLTEKIGSECEGKVWVCCTGQEAIDEIIKVRADEFSRIQARFKTRLSLTSSSVDEVVQKRILKKTPKATAQLSQVYDQKDSVLRNLFTFTGAQMDIKGYSGEKEFTVNFPFVPYQFIAMQKVFNEIRKHGNAGKHQSNGERSMLSGFQEAAQKIQDRDEYALVPFFSFYDTVHTFLDSSIRRVIERCERAANAGDGIEVYDVDVLKLLYLIRYIGTDIPANLDNIVVLMADDIRVDKISLREIVRNSLNRLLSQNYIGRTGETYNFLTDEEQDIQKAIKNDTSVDTAAIVERIAQMIFADIYTTKKYRYGKYDFVFDQMVDGVTLGAVTGGMRLKFLTDATDAAEKSKLRLMSESTGQAIVVLAETNYYNALEQAMKIRKYIKQHNVAQLPKSVQNIIRNQQDEAIRLETSVTGELRKAIVGAEFYVAGEHIEIKVGDAKTKIDHALKYLVAHVYSDLNLIDHNVESDADILAILNGTITMLPGNEPNRGAAAKMEEYLEVQHRKNLPTSMADVQRRYQAIPYGWREIDIAAVAARLIYDQKVTVKYAGTTMQPGNPKLPDMLRKKSEIGKTSISRRQVVSITKMKEVKEFLREYYDIMDVPDDEDGLISFIVKKFTVQKQHYEDLNLRYFGHIYPDHAVVSAAIQLMDDVLSQQKDNIALIDCIIKKEDALDENLRKMQHVEAFFKNQVTIFDEAVQMEAELHHDLDYLSHEPESDSALDQIRLICMIQAGGNFDYKRIPELNSLMTTVTRGHKRLLKAKRDELLEIVRQCMEAIHTVQGGNVDTKNIIQAADNFYSQKKQQINELNSLALLDGLLPPMLQYKDTAVDRLETAAKLPAAPSKSSDSPADSGQTPFSAPKKVYKQLNRSIVFPAKKLESEAEIDDYVEKIRSSLKQLLNNCDGIRIK